MKPSLICLRAFEFIECVYGVYVCLCSMYVTCFLQTLFVCMENCIFFSAVKVNALITR